MRQRSSWKIYGPLLAIVVAVVLLYCRSSQAYFCGHDDFVEVHRAAYEDAKDPSKIITTPHGSFKYRPLNRGVILLTYWLGEGSPLAFRVRNLVFHLLSVSLVYGLGWVLFRSQPTSVLGAAVFGFHPLSNQTVIGAVSTNTVAHSALLASLLLFVMAVQRYRTRSALVLAAGASVCAGFGLFLYESEIVAFAGMTIYSTVHYFRARDRRGWIILAVSLTGAALSVGFYLFLRQSMVPGSWSEVAQHSPAFSTIAKNLAAYGFALLWPIDLVLANEYFGTPLASELDGRERVILAGVLLVVLLGVALGAWLWVRSHMRVLENVDWPSLTFLFLTGGLTLAPLILFEPHPSETYLYLPIAFLSLAGAYCLTKLAGFDRPLVPFGFAIPLLALLLAGTWVRNERIVQCGDTARRILYSLPNELGQGAWSVFFTRVGGDEKSTRYGFYAYSGLDTIGYGSWGDWASTAALRLAYKNELLTAKVLSFSEGISESLEEQDPTTVRKLCVRIHSDGKTDWSPLSPR